MDYLKKLDNRIYIEMKKTVSLIKKSRLPKAENFLYGMLVVLALAFGGALLADNLRIAKIADQDPMIHVPTKTERKAKKLTAGYPMERMAPYIGMKDEKTASYLLAIAKKESNWGKFTPKKNGKECFNYWGYRGPENTTASGYSCFENSRQAVAVVGGRINKLLAQKIDTPSEMVVWKCGKSCESHDPVAVQKWISDVDWYVDKFYQL